MNATAPASDMPPASARASGLAPRPPRLARRQRRAREAARQRNAAHVTRPLTAAQKARAVPRQRPAWVRALAAIAAVLGSAAAHGAIVIIGLVTAAMNLGATRAEEGPITFAVREPEVPEAEPPEPSPEPEPEPTAVTRPSLAPAAAPPEPVPEIAPPEEPPAATPLRVVGLSLEATVEGGGGPAFAVGQTRLGETAARAAEATRAAPATTAPATTKTTNPAATTTANRAASRIPTAKVEYQMPKRKQPRLPTYPPTLKTQGIEADVTVMVSLDATGKVTEVKLIAPSPYPDFNEAARTTALAEEFEPALRDGVPVPYTLSYTYRFRIEER